MSFARSKAPLLACAVLFASPLFGCAINPHRLQAPVALGGPAPVRLKPWAGIQPVPDLQLLAQLPRLAFDPVLPRPETESRHAAGEPASVQPGEPVFDQQVLAAHNRERLGLGLIPLSWNSALAQSAKRWADHLASTGRFEHAPENRVAPQGENLWAGTKGYFSPERMVNAWIREKKNFRPGTFPDNSTTGRVEDVGHYTQVVWRATTQVGCAEARSRNEDILVCRYAEAGNYRDEVPF